MGRRLCRTMIRSHEERVSGPPPVSHDDPLALKLKRQAKPGQRVWLFDLDNTLHNASQAAFAGISQAMSVYIQRELQITREQSDALR